MMLSEISLDTLLSLPYARKWEISCSGIQDDGCTSDTALLLGGRPVRAIERAGAAADLYHAGRVKRIIPTGGVIWDYQGKLLTEAELMTRVLLSRKVPFDAIIMENEARTTRENMVYGVLQMVRKFERLPDLVTIVTSVTHMKRSFLLAETLLPRKIGIHMYPSYPDLPKEQWLEDPANRKLLDDGLRLLQELVDRKDVRDIEIFL